MSQVPPATAGRSIYAQLMRSHQSIALIGVGMLVVSLLTTFWVRSHTTRFATVRGPIVSSATTTQSGLQRSLAGLRGWMVLPDPAFREVRLYAWEQEIHPALTNLRHLGAGVQMDGFDEQLDRLTQILAELHEWQSWIHDIAQTPGNEPARVMLDRKVRPLAARLLAGMSAMLDLQKREPVAPVREALLSTMADLRHAVMQVRTGAISFARDGDPADEATIQVNLQTAAREMRRIEGHLDALQPEQRDLVGWLTIELLAYEARANEIITLRSSQDWNLARHLFATHANPLGIAAAALLTDLSTVQHELMEAEAADVVRISNAAVIVLCGLILLMALSAFLISRSRARQITAPLSALSEATQAFASGELSADLPVLHDDEIGRLTSSFNVMRASLRLGEATLQEREEHLRAVVTSIIDGIITIDVAGVIRSFNRAAEEIFGYTVDEVLGHNVKMLMPAPYRTEHDGYLHNYHQSGEAKVIGIGREVVGQRKDGSTFLMDLAVSEMSVGDGRMFAGIVRDITDRKQAEEGLREATEQAEEANRAKSNFLATMSHELRTPLNAVIGYSEMLIESAEDDERQQDADDAGRIQIAGHHLLELINEVLDLSKIEAGEIELHLEDIDIAVMVDSVEKTVDPLMQKNANRFSAECSDDIGIMHADLTRVRQVLFNILSNAAKFTHEGTITLRAERETTQVPTTGSSSVQRTPASA